MNGSARTTTTAPGRQDAGAPALDAHVQNTLGLALRAVYERACVAEAIPDDQVELLLRLRRKERERRRIG